MSYKNRIARLEAKQPPADRPVWAEFLGDGLAVLRFQDGRRVEATEADIPQGTKVYAGFSPDNWGVTHG